MARNASNTSRAAAAGSPLPVASATSRSASRSLDTLTTLGTRDVPGVSADRCRPDSVRLVRSRKGHDMSVDKARPLPYAVTGLSTLIGKVLTIGEWAEAARIPH